MLQRSLPGGFIAPCLPTKTDKLPSGSQWLHEIKHDGFRIIARKNGAQVRLHRLTDFVMHELVTVNFRNVERHLGLGSPGGKDG